MNMLLIILIAAAMGFLLKKIMEWYICSCIYNIKNLSDEDLEKEIEQYEKDNKINEMWDKFYAENKEYVDCCGWKPKNWSDEKYDKVIDYAIEFEEKAFTLEQESDEFWEKQYMKTLIKC